MARQKRNFISDSGWGSIDLIWATTVICEFCNLKGIEWRFSNFRVVISAEGNVDLSIGDLENEYE